jgi:hypothetical protein
MISLQDRTDILDLCARYSYFTDTGAAEDVANLFLPDGVFDGPPGQFEGSQAILQFNKDIHELIKGSMHFTDNHLFEDCGDYIRHRCHSKLLMPSDDGVSTTLMTYDDEVVKVGGEWKFRIRKNRLFDPSAF